MTDFNAVDPKITPAIPEKQYPLYWMRLCTISAPGPTSEARIYAEFQPYRRIVEDGQVVGAEVKTPEVQGDIMVIEAGNLFELASRYPEIATAMDALLTALKSQGAIQGKFS